MISRGLYFSDIPDLAGNEFIHMTQKCINSISIRSGSAGYGRVLTVHRARSLITRIFRSISPTCSLAAVVLRVTFGIRVLRHSNSWSIREVCTMKPAVPYIVMTLFSVLTSRLAVRDGKYSMVTKLIPLEEVTKNGKPLTNITSATNVTYLCSWTKSRGI